MFPVLLVFLLLLALIYLSTTPSSVCSKHVVESYEEDGKDNPVLAYVRPPHAGGQTSETILLENPPYLVKTNLMKHNG